jgi:hypothetical protein
MVEKYMTWQKLILMNFIDFKKAIDCIHRESLWMQSMAMAVNIYGISDKIIGIMKSFYKSSSCAVRVDGVFSKFFKIRSGVRHGCVLSLLLFGK